MDTQMLPYSRDGSTFDHSCRYKDGLFRIGAKGRELKVRSYSLALALLAAMPIARWRRPNRRGNFGIVRARRWA